MFNSRGTLTIVATLMLPVWFASNYIPLLRSILGLSVVVAIAIWGGCMAYKSRHLSAFLGGIFGGSTLFVAVFYLAYLADMANGYPY